MDQSLAGGFVGRVPRLDPALAAAVGVGEDVGVHVVTWLVSQDVEGCLERGGP